MKSKTGIYCIILITATLLAMWAIPALLKKATDKPADYPFAYYSSIIKELCFIDFHDKEAPMKDKSGNIYTTQQFDSLMPLLNFRQLMVDGKMPDSLDGYELTPQLVRSKNVVFRFTPTDIRTPQTDLYVMFESMPKRVGLEVPDDVFRLTRDGIEFIDAKSNRINEDKSEQFRTAMIQEGFTFPMQWASGNINPRKPYDEGYFCLDRNGHLFHLKMVNNRPFVRDTQIGDSIDIASFSMLEVGDKRFYGFLFDRQGGVYIIESNDGKYRPVRLDIGTVDTRSDEMLLMGNLLYWTVSVTTPSGIGYYALRTETLERVDEYHIACTPGVWNRVSEWLFPAYLTFDHPDSDYIYPAFVFTGIKAFAVNALLALLVFGLVANTRKRKIFHAAFLLFTGIAGLIALLLLPDFKYK